MTAALAASDFLRLPLAALKPVCRALSARLTVATNFHHALDGLYYSPSGFNVAIVPGDELPLADSLAGEQHGDLQMWSVGISILVSHRLPPTIEVAQGLYDNVGGMPPFLDLVSRIRDAIRQMQMPAGSTGGFWTYKSRQYIAVAGDDKMLPVYKLDFEIEATPPYPDGSPEICPPDIGGDDDELLKPEEAEGE